MSEYRIADLSTEAEYYLTRPEFNSARAAYYRQRPVGMPGPAPRDDAAMPMLAPPGMAVLRRITGIGNRRSWVDAPMYDLFEPENDAIFDPAQLVALPPDQAPPGTPYTRPYTQAELDAYVRGTPLPSVAQRTTIIPDPSKVVVLLTDPDLSKISPPKVLRVGEVGPHVDLYPQPVNPAYAGLWSVRVADPALHGRLMVRPDRGAIVRTPESAWRNTRWGTEVAVAFVPPYVVHGFSNGPARIVSFGDAGETDIVLVSANHPLIPPTALERQREPGAPAPAGYVPVRTRALAFHEDSGNRPNRTEYGWRGQLYEEKGTNLWERVTQTFDDALHDVRREATRAVRNVADPRWWAETAQRVGQSLEASAKGIGRNLEKLAHGDLDALQAIGAAVVTTAVLGPAGVTIAGSDQPWRDAARLGSIFYAFEWSPLAKAVGARTATGSVPSPVSQSASVAEALAQSQVRPGVSDLSIRRYQFAPGVEVTVDDLAAAEVLSLRLAALDPDGAQAFLERLTLAVGFPDLIFARLTIEAQENAKKREALKAEIVGLQAEWWDRYGQYIAQGLGHVLSIFGSPLVGTAIYAILRALYQGAIVLQQVEVGLRAQRQAEAQAAQLEREIMAQIEALEAELGIPPGSGPAVVPAGAGTPPATVTPEQRAEWWLGWLIRKWWPDKA